MLYKINKLLKKIIPFYISFSFCMYNMVRNSSDKLREQVFDKDKKSCSQRKIESKSSYFIINTGCFIRNQAKTLVPDF